MLAEPFLSLALLLTPCNEIAYSFKGPVIDAYGELHQLDFKVSSHIDREGWVWISVKGADGYWCQFDRQGWTGDGGSARKSPGLFYLNNVWFALHRHDKDHNPIHPAILWFRFTRWEAGRRPEN